MKPILTILLLFFSSYLFAQNIIVNISDLPRSIAELLEGINNSIDQDNPEKFTHSVDGINVWVQNNKYGNKSYLKMDYQGASEKSYYAHFKKNDKEKGGVEIEDLTNDKTIGSFKIKSTKNTYYNSIAFSMDGKYLIAMGVDEENDGVVYSYAFDMETKKLVIDGRIVELERPPSTMLKVGGSGNYMFGSGYYNRLFMVNITTGEAITLPMVNNVNELNYLYPSINSDYVLAVKENSTYFFDTKSRTLIYSKKKDYKSPIESFFVNAEGTKTEKNISQKPLSGPGVGLVVFKESVLVFDQNQNYFAIAEKGKSVDVLQHFSFKGQSGTPEPQPDLIPILPDNLTNEGLKLFFENTASVCKTHNNRKLAFQVFESAEPFSDELVIALSQSDKKYVVEYVGKYVAQWINKTPKMELAETGKASNINRKKFMDSYANYAKNLSQDEFGSYLADASEIQNALEKLQPLTVDLYYMSVDELFKKGNEALQAGAKLSPKAVLLGIRFYEVAAEKEPTEPIYQVSIGSAYMYAGQYANAIESYNKALAIHPDYPLALFGIMKASFVPITKGETTFNNNVAKSIQSNANRFLAVAPADYLPEKKYAKRAKAFAKLYLDDKELYTQYNQATGQSNILMRTGAVELLMPKIAATGNTYLVADMANVSGFDYIKIGESNNNEVNYYKQADKLLRKSVKGGVYDPETYYEWARININYLDNKEEGKRIVEEAQKKYPSDKNFGVLIANDYYNAGREFFLSKSYAKAIPNFEKYLANANKIVPKAYDYLGVSYYNTKNYPKAVANFELLKSKDNPNTLQAFYPNFETVLAYAKNPSGAAPKLIDNADKIDEIEEQYVQGTRLLKNGQRSEGLRLMEQAVAYYDQINYDYGQSIAHSGLGVAYQDAGENNKAEPHYKSCISNGAQSSTCYNNLAILYIKNNQINAAKALVKEGLKKYPNAEDLARVKKYLYQ